MLATHLATEIINTFNSPSVPYLFHYQHSQTYGLTKKLLSIF